MAFTLTFAQRADAESNWSSWINAAQLDWAHHDLLGAEKNFKQSLANGDPKDIWQMQWSHYYLGKLYLSQLKLPLSEKEFNAVLALSRKSGIADDALDSLAHAYHLHGNEPAAARLRAELRQKRFQNSHGYMQYMERLTRDVKGAWQPRELRTSASSVVAFYLDRGGNAKEVHLASSSGVAAADQIAIETMESMPSFGKLPGADEEPCVIFSFDYNFHQAAKGPQTGIRADLGDFIDPYSPAQIGLAEKTKRLAAKEQELKRQLMLVDSASEPPSAALPKLSQLMDCLIEEKKFIDAQKIITRILSFYKNDQPEDLLAAHVWLQSGEIASAENKLEQARDCYKHSVSITERVGPEGSAQDQQSKLAFAKCLYKLGETDAANVLYEKLKTYKTAPRK